MSDEGQAAEPVGRTEQLRVRLSTFEKGEIWRRAARAGLSPSEYIREMALGNGPARRSSASAPTIEEPREELSTVNAQLTPEGGVVQQAGLVSEVPEATVVEPLDVKPEHIAAALPNPDARVAAAPMVNGETEGEFISRRIDELTAEGEARHIAQHLALAEWRRQLEPQNA